ncbi:MAG TPA: hypothetical protein VLX91_12590 [Candidatus Acidoferrales bacterium]|nr:hypothetical protein [Candidatus Acidoferrales bacterium]
MKKTIISWNLHFLIDERIAYFTYNKIWSFEEEIIFGDNHETCRPRAFAL